MAKRGGKGSRARSKERRAAEKRKRKAMMKQQYAAWRDEGINQKRGRSGTKKKVTIRRRHPDGNCGNIGCALCSPSYHTAEKVARARARYQAGQ